MKKITDDSPNLTYSIAEWKKASDVLIHRHHFEYCFETNDSISELTLLEEEIRQAMIVFVFITNFIFTNDSRM